MVIHLLFSSQKIELNFGDGASPQEVILQLIDHAVAPDVEEKTIILKFRGKVKFQGDVHEKKRLG
jgi:hypothetical protein